MEISDLQTQAETEVERLRSIGWTQGDFALALKELFMPRIDLDYLLNGGDKGDPTWEEVVEFWKEHDFISEEYLVQAIEKYLQTPEQRQQIFDVGLSIEKMLNGRFTGLQEAFVEQIYEAWNTKLGFKSFGF